MRNPKFSVIIPAYNQAQFLTDAIQSVLTQTEPDFELIIVNDASPDNTAEVVAQYTDPRVKLLTHTENKGLPASRNTGMQAATGEFIALLDSDDYFHPDKLAAHASFFDAHPEIDITYNNRYELHHSSQEIRAIYQPPATIELSDLVLGFPFSPSDMVLRHSTVDEVGMFDARYKCGGEDLDYPCRLALAQKRFQRINKALNYRRFHTRRKKKNLTCRLEDYTRALDQTFSHPRFEHQPEKIRQQALANRYLEVACWALMQADYLLGNELLQEIAVLNPDIFSGHPAQLTRELLKHSIRDFNQDHAQIITRIFQHFDPQFQHLNTQLDAAISSGYLRKGLQELLWNRVQNGQTYIAMAKQQKAEIDQALLDKIIAQLILIRAELGTEAVKQAFAHLKNPVVQLGGKAGLRYLYGTYGLNSAFAHYRAAAYNAVLKDVFWVAQHAPGRLINRGVGAITLKSIAQYWQR